MAYTLDICPCKALLRRLPPQPPPWPASTSGWRARPSATVLPSAKTSPMRPPPSGSRANSSTSKTSSSTTPAWTSAAPTHELTRAHAVLRTRRLILSQKPDWALSRDGLLALDQARGRFAGYATAAVVAEGQGASAAFDVRSASGAFGSGAAAIAPAVSEEIEVAADTVEEADEPDLLDEEFAAIDAVLARSSKVLEGDVLAPPEKPAAESGRAPQNSLVYDLDWNEEERFAE